ncbi:pyrin-like [Acipenser oxyrinchus oxyrinchus]|uniref:Pyrin-like n=1 Tax=Acipenser oxyrinchus oxyrinchus TaxID=40147 RepID=A0AAD8CHB5_ACIOX|nr:pyrin-like [Acipenser oxyrinchus oxyrinchus]
MMEVMLKVLDELQEPEFRRLKCKLSELAVDEGYDRIPRGPLELASKEQVASLLLDYYPEDYAVELTQHALKAINKRRLSCYLVKHLAAARNTCFTVKPAEAIRNHSCHLSWVFRTVLLFTTWYLRNKKS